MSDPEMASTVSVATSATSSEPSLLDPSTSIPERDDDHYLRTLHLLRSKLNTVEAQINNHNSGLREAQLMRAQIRESINQHLMTHPPNHKFPPEILAHVFWHTQTESFRASDTKSGPWALGQVCSKWRTIVWETPRLWADFSIDTKNLLGRMTVPVRSSAFRLFSDVLARSKEVPLTVNLNYGLEWFSECYRLVAREAYRIDLLYLTGSQDELWEGFLTEFPQLPKLRAMVLTIDGDGDLDHVQELIIAPELRLLQINFQDRPESVSMPIPYSQLRHLNVVFQDDRPSLSLTLSVLRQCPNLEAFRDSSDYSGITYLLDPIPLNNLVDIVIYSPTLLGHIITPALKVLRFSHAFNQFIEAARPNPVDSVVKTFQERSKCRINATFLLPIPPSDICRAFLRVFSDLAWLAISLWNEKFDDEYAPSFISLLKVAPDSEVFMPRLEVLNVCLSVTPHMMHLLGPEPELPKDTALELALADVILVSQCFAPSKSYTYVPGGTAECVVAVTFIGKKCLWLPQLPRSTRNFVTSRKEACW